LRHRNRLSVAEGLHCISVPSTVSPYAQCWEQNAPGCTPWIVCAGAGLALRVVVFAFGLAFAFGLVAAGPGVGGGGGAGDVASSGLGDSFGDTSTMTALRGWSPGITSGLALERQPTASTSASAAVAARVKVRDGFTAPGWLPVIAMSPADHSVRAVRREASGYCSAGVFPAEEGPEESLGGHRPAAMSSARLRFTS
jgi:hypothetical protein